jgi:hypothetical protein
MGKRYELSLLSQAVDCGLRPSEEQSWRRIAISHHFTPIPALPSSSRVAGGASSRNNAKSPTQVKMPLLAQSMIER